ncbi:MAG: hemin uptake protein HemP [Rhodocyclales bacterium]|nr:hemin uptake protein HemP [Rhodocyclales bacterium]
MKPLPPSSTSRPATPTMPPPMPRIDSAALLGLHQEIGILHAGETYRLRRTRQGKLILTK